MFLNDTRDEKADLKSEMARWNEDGKNSNKKMKKRTTRKPSFVVVS